MKYKKLILLFILMNFVSRAQESANDNVPFHLGKESFNLRDSVKTVKFRYSFYRKGLSSAYDRSTFYNTRDVKHDPLHTFYPNGLLKISHNSQADSIYRDIILNDVANSEYEYSNEDILSKKVLKINHKHYYPISDDYLLRNTNYNVRGYPSTIVSSRDLLENIYKYTLDEKNRVKEILEYFVSHLEDTIPSGKIAKEDLWLRIVNYYNEKNLVIKQKVLNGPKDNFDPSFQFSYESSEFCNDLELRYNYDSQNRMIQSLLYGCGKIVMQEDYTYHPTKDFVEQVVYYMDGRMSTVFMPTKRFIKTYNEYGDVIENRFLPDYEGQSNKKMRSRYYVYEYDAHNNWTKCYMYLEGTKEGEPTMIAERQIEYYK